MGLIFKIYFYLRHPRFYAKKLRKYYTKNIINNSVYVQKIKPIMLVFKNYKKFIILIFQFLKFYCTASK